MKSERNWAKEDIYLTPEKWEEDFLKASEFQGLSAFKGKLGEKNEFLKCMKRQEEISRLIDKLYVYAYMVHDEDTSLSSSSGRLAKIQGLAVKISSEASFITPELTALSEETLNSYINSPELKDYDYFLRCLLAEKEHVLDESAENVLALSGDVLSSFKDIFTKIDNADLPLGKFRHSGETIEITHGGFGACMHASDRLLRKKYFKKYYSAYKSLLNTITATYYASVKKDVFIARARKYNSALECALLREDVPVSVYENLLRSVNDNLHLLHEYMHQKKKESGLKKFCSYDVYASTVKDAELNLEYEDAYNLCLEGLKPLGEDYVSLLKRARAERWIDVDEKKGKRSGAYSICVYDTHPFVLLNYSKTTHDVFTIAHELGHSLHSYYSNKNQPYAKADYKIFVAEVASTVNEVLLINHLLSSAIDRKTEKFLLSYFMEMIRTTLYRQTQFAEFEQYSHSLVEKGEPLTKDGMSAKYLEINEKYYGKAVENLEEISYEWARIPHFYRAFYVYKYATGIISAITFADKILEEGESAVKVYKEFLSSGGKEGPVEILKKAGVDLTTSDPYMRAFKTFEKLLSRYKEIE